MSSKNALGLLVVLALLGFVGAVGMYWLFAPSQVAQVVKSSLILCPPVPRHKTGFAISSYYELTGRITFQASEDMAADTEEFGWVYDGFDDYTLYVDRRYDFQEVLAYLQSLRSVPQGHATPTPTPTATPELDVNGWIEWLTSQWHFTPDLDDWLLIDWPDSIIITDALSQTIVIQGPATVRFGEGASR